MTSSKETSNVPPRPASSRALLLGGVAMLVAGAVAAQAATTVSSKTRVAGFLSATLATLMATKGVAISPPPRPTPAPTPPPVAKPATIEMARMGINLAPPVYYSNLRAFANLATGAHWGSSLNGEPIPDDRIDAKGMPIRLLPGESSMYILNPPRGAFRNGANIACTYQGEGDLRVEANSTKRDHRPGRISFFWPASTNKAYISEEDVRVFLKLYATNPSNPIRNLDCREAEMDRSITFDPDFIADVRRFGILRFMDWQNTNHNARVTWANRTQRGALNSTTHDGVSIEDMVALANEAGVQPWFNISWNADEEYVRRFAEYVRDNLRPDLLAYVETSNEVWNWAFPVSHQASREGLDRGLGKGNMGRAMVDRYAQRSKEVLSVWTEVFRSNPSRIVRVVGSQNAYISIGDEILSFPGLTDHVDALAVAPYFGHEVFEGAHANDENIESIFARLPATVDTTIAQAVQNKATAAKYGKRLIAYEGGQHVMTRNVDLLQRIQRDPRMYDLYRRYLEGWRTRVSDRGMVLFNDVGSISQWGSWGLREYQWQPVADAPKMRAVFDQMAAHGR